MAPQPQKFEYFFDLPPELRGQILSYICVFPTPILVGGGPGGSNGSGKLRKLRRLRRPPPTNLFLASPVLHREAGHLYYSRNTFHISFPPPPSCSRKRTRGLPHRPRHQQLHIDTIRRLLTHPDTTHARRRIRAAVVSVRGIGAQLQNVVVPAVADMVLRGALRQLCVNVLGSAPPSGPLLSFKDGPDGEIAYSFSGGVGGDGVGGDGVVGCTDPALRALLVLLVDPGLRQREGGGGARLRVLKGWHAPFWCQFHEQTSPSSSSTTTTVGGGGVDGEGGGAVGAVSCAMLKGRFVSGAAAAAAVAAAVAAAAAAASGRGVGDDGFLEVDICGLVDAVCAGDGAEFNIKKV
ncbi:predicted protein [Chaetomium globosum CBS 148.51]|uniref:Uncharacterized protein n=1 Tax=Chaetomium globosum (strain ATCC 6205 / CBS 148.51 / DSM 1962 / NBRC 6347 / NRRL 1970) TaxID=306901 RepID=Q2HDN0_CHAGB|nr:uncharacterized protein CHGG_01674 [Chaetomium globosum CBS 148.51]EAQ93439.1 predicted protein [Chaetomium globosum CBS 148.51]